MRSASPLRSPAPVFSPDVPRPLALRPPVLSHLLNVWHEVVWDPDWVLAQVATGMGAHRVEVPGCDRCKTGECIRAKV